MPNIGMVELLIIAIVALIVIGPKDLPKVFHNLGKMTAKLRSMSREFSRAMEDAARESGVDGMTKDLKGLSNPSKFGLDAIKDAASDATKGLDDWDPDTASSEAAKRGPHTQALTEERAEAARKIREAASEKAQKRIDEEKAADVEKPAKPKAAAKKPKKTAKKKVAPAGDADESGSDKA